MEKLEKIKWEDKEPLMTRPEVPDTKKFTSGNMNEIKAVVNGVVDGYNEQIVEFPTPEIEEKIKEVAKVGTDERIEEIVNAIGGRFNLIELNNNQWDELGSWLFNKNGDWETIEITCSTVVNNKFETYLITCKNLKEYKYVNFTIQGGLGYRGISSIEAVNSKTTIGSLNWVYGSQGDQNFAGILFPTIKIDKNGASYEMIQFNIGNYIKAKIWQFIK